MSALPRIAFFGRSGTYSQHALRSAASSGEVVAVVESAPRSAGQHVARRYLTRAIGQWKGFGLRRWAHRRGLPYFYLTRKTEPKLADFLRQNAVDLGCVASFSQLLKSDVLNTATLGFLNVHPSLLPLYRGPNPWFWQYYQMERTSGVTVHFLDDGEDTGDIVRQSEMPVALGEAPASLIERAGRLGGKVLGLAIDDIKRDAVRRIHQRDSKCPCRGRNIKVDEQLIDWHDWPLHRVWHVIRGTQPWLRSLPEPRGWQRGFVWRIDDYELTPCDLQPGQVGKDSRGYFVAHPEGTIRLSADFNLRRWTRYWCGKLI